MAPTISLSSASNATTLSTPTSNGLTSLRSVSDILHLSFHRNKNQHRLAKWWSSLSQLRRQVQKLVKDLETLETAEKYEIKPVAKGKGKKGLVRKTEVKQGKGSEGKYVVAARKKARERVDYMETWLVPGCYTAFTNLIADNQYAPLGLILMATLARTNRIIRHFGSEILSPHTLPLVAPVLSPEQDFLDPTIPDEGSGYDLGEVVNRSKLNLEMKAGEPVVRTGGKDDVDEEVVGRARDEGVRIGEVNGGEDEEEIAQVKKAKKKRKEVADEELAEAEAAKATPKAKRVKKKKGGDEFDDLFSSLM